MEKTKGNIGIKEFVALIILSVGTKLADDTPSILFESVENAAWIAITLISLITVIPIVCLTKVITLYPNKNLIEIIIHLFGKYIGFFVLFLLWIMQTQAITVNSAMYTDIIGSMYFTKTPSFVIYAVLMAVAAYGAKKGLAHIGQVAWTMLIWIKISLFIVLILSFVQGQVNFLFPIFGPGIKEILKESTLHTSILGDFLFLGLIASFLKNSKVYKKGIWIGFLFVSIEFTLTLIGYVMIFDYHGVQMVNYPYHETIRYIELGFITNVESLFFPFWLVASFIRFSFYLYLTALLFGALFKVKEFEYIIPSLATLIVFVGLIPDTPIFFISYLTEISLVLTTPIIFLLPFLLWVTAIRKGDFKKNATSSET